MIFGIKYIMITTLNLKYKIMIITIKLTDLEIKKLEFCIDYGLNINHAKLSKLDLQFAFINVIKQAIHSNYKKELEYVHQGEDHDGTSLTKEII